MDQTEAEVVKDVKKIIKKMGLDDYIQRINAGWMKNQYGRPIRLAKKGTLDFEGFSPSGKFVGMECKRTKGGKLSPEQAERIELINHCGGYAAVIKSKQEAECFLTKILEAKV